MSTSQAASTVSAPDSSFATSPYVMKAKYMLETITATNLELLVAPPFVANLREALVRAPLLTSAACRLTKLTDRPSACSWGGAV